MTARLIFCKKLQAELPGLEKPPFKGAVGEMIFEHISQQAWSMWKDDMQIKVINEYRINLGDKDQYEKFIEQMLFFLNLKEGNSVEVENANRGRGE